MSQNKIKVSFLQRKRRKAGNFSMEFIFDDVREKLKDVIEPKVHISPYLSNGIFRRVVNTIDAPFNQAEVNHVTGDIHYVTLFLKKNRTVLTVLDCGFMHRTKGIRQKILQWIWLRMPVNRVQYVTAISEATKKDIIKYANCPADKVHVIPVAVSPVFKPAPFNFNKAKPRLLQIGTAPNKNIHRLVEAIAEMNCVLVIIGNIKDDLMTLLKEKQIEFENYKNIPTAQVLEEYTKSDIVTFASTFEGFGMPIVEANWVERPVITGNTSSMPEIAGDAACIVDPFDVDSIRAGLNKIINDDDYRNQLVENGRKNRMRFHPNTIAQQYYGLYKRIHESN